MKHIPLLLLTLIALAFAGCGQKEAAKPPEKIVNVTTATVKVKDLAVVESAVGNATALGVAQALDPNTVRRGSFTVRLPFPEQVARQLRIGQSVKLTSFSDPGKVAQASVKEIRPALDTSTQTMEVIAELPGGREWYSLGSVRGEVVVGVHRGALLVPEQAAVLRPAGTVVYVPDNEAAAERVVKTGLTRDGELEILSGLKAGETVVVDGAGLLSNGAKLRVMNAAPAAGAKP
jgi:multidrug efflux pump subunit AcrA (membrane-fusion protein)